MATKATIIWDKEAKKTYFEMLQYLAREFSLQSAENLIEAIEQATERICDYPTSFRQSSIDSNIRFILVGKHRRLYYRIKGNSIRIIFLFDTRQDPKNDPFQ
ncbi:MAG TPA: type II toxin-antitoxin system RelE/ParE family toxin [Saprospiraceae bacterium]|nr:type II toxin-antitoxin system RelE/ParE family toxin [Saprospiraceae bacterium]